MTFLVIFEKFLEVSWIKFFCKDLQNSSMNFWKRYHIELQKNQQLGYAGVRYYRGDSMKKNEILRNFPIEILELDFWSNGVFWTTGDCQHTQKNFFEPKGYFGTFFRKIFFSNFVAKMGIKRLHLNEYHHEHIRKIESNIVRT